VYETRALTRTLPPTFFFACTRLVPDVFAAFTTTRVAETANMTDDRSTVEVCGRASRSRAGWFRHGGGGWPIGTRRGAHSIHRHVRRGVGRGSWVLVIVIVIVMGFVCL